MKLGLLLIDIQNDYFKGGNSELFQPEYAAAKATKLLSYFRKNSLPIFHIQHINIREGATFFLPNTFGVDIHKSVYPHHNEVRIIKHSPDSFFQTILKSEIDNQNVDNLVICGMMTHMCIDTTVRAAKKFNYNIILIEDACTTKNLEWKGKTLPAANVQSVFMASLSGAFADITTADKFILKQL